MVTANVNFSHADLVQDRFRVMEHLNEGVDMVRTQERAELCDYSRDLLTGHKYIFLQYTADWNAEEKQSFQELHRKDMKVTKTWGRRETFQSIWTFTVKNTVRHFIHAMAAEVHKNRAATDHEGRVNATGSSPTLAQLHHPSSHQRRDR